MSKSVDEEMMQEYKRVYAMTFQEHEDDLNLRFPINSFPGSYPTRIIRNNIEQRYNHLSQDAEKILLEEKSQGTITDCIKLLYNSTKTGPYCKYCQSPKSWEIFLPERFVAYIWCFSYYFLISIERIVQDNEKGNKTPHTYISDEMLVRAKEIFDKGLAIMKGNDILWTIDEPNPFPTCNNVDSEPGYCILANHLAINAVTFCLYHELGHTFFLKHPSMKLQSDEFDADRFAIELASAPFAPLSNEDLALSCLFALSCILFCSKDITKEGFGTHPHPIKRIQELFNFHEEHTFIAKGFSENLRKIYCLILTNVIGFYGISYSSMDKDSSLEDAIRYLECIIDPDGNVYHNLS